MLSYAALLHIFSPRRSRLHLQIGVFNVLLVIAFFIKFYIMLTCKMGMFPVCYKMSKLSNVYYFNMAEFANNLLKSCFSRGKLAVICSSCLPNTGHSLLSLWMRSIRFGADRFKRTIKLCF